MRLVTILSIKNSVRLPKKKYFWLLSAHEKVKINEVFKRFIGTTKRKYEKGLEDIEIEFRQRKKKS